MTKLEQAARQALEVLKNQSPDRDMVRAAFALQEALAEQATVSGGLCGGCAKKAADGWALYCVECLEKAEQEPITTPDVCGEVCARAKLCYGCNKDLEEANAKYAEQAEQEPVAWSDAQISRAFKNSTELHKDVTSFTAFKRAVKAIESMHGYAAPVRTKDLTNDEIRDAMENSAVPYYEITDSDLIDFARAVIAADREKNK